ncbi:MAG: ABC transporter permease [Myxococcota bacterium]
MSGPAFRHLWHVALGTLAMLFAVALFADQLASDKPVGLRLAGVTYLFPNVFDPPALRTQTIHSLRARLDRDRGDWMLEPLVPFGPHQTFAHQEERGPPPWPPDAEHPLGTDELGRDVFARIVHGARVSLTVGLVAVGLYVLIGVFLGAIAGFYRGWVDAVVSRAIEVVMSFPTLFLVLAVLGVMRVRSLWPVMVVIGLTRWTEVARLVRGEVLRLKGQDFVLASRALGASDAHLLVRHLLPNALGPVLVAATFGVAGAILLESGLSFLGLGVPPPTPSWGELLTQAHRYLTHPGAWWLTLYPGLAIFLTVTAFHLAGEGLRDALDPRLKD